jgi:putative acetyltransferase
MPSAQQNERSMTSIDIRIADPGDPAVRPLVSALDDYLAGLYPAESNHGLSLTALQADDVHFVAAEVGGRPVGCAALRIDAAYGEVKRMFVQPETRGTGIGRALLAHLEALALARGLPCLRLETGVAQPEAVGLYEAAGFRRISPFPPYRPDPLSIFMEKPLERSTATRVEPRLERSGSLP